MYNCSAKTIKRHLDKFEVTPLSEFASHANILMDTTYWGKNFGVMVFKDSISRDILYKQYVTRETNKLYYQGIEEISRRGIQIQSIVCDGRKGLLQMFPNIPVQMCQFHQVQIVTRYLTKRPKSNASKALRAISLILSKTTKNEFIASLDTWYKEWEWYLKERSKSTITGKSFYTHKRLRSAYFSLRRNIPYLFVFEDYASLGMHNTTNALDGIFSDLKQRLRSHNGLSLARKKRFIDGFFKA